MKRFYFLQIIIIAVLFSACSLADSAQKTEKNADNNQKQNNSRTAPNLSNDVSENQADSERKNAFANLETEGTNLPMEKSGDPQQANAVCPIPDQPCSSMVKEFADWELSFKLPAKIAPNKTYSSVPFYAVMVKTYKSDDDCDGGEYIESLETERKQLQKLQPERKVFAAYACPNMDAVNYDFEGRWDKANEVELVGNFIAVYAGQTEAEAENLLNDLQDKYPKAVVKKMTANWERIEQ